MAKVSIVKWSQKLIFVDGTPFFGPTPDFEIALKTAIFKIFGYARNGTSVNKNPFLRPLYNRYICHITIVKWSRIIQTSIKKCIFWDILILCPFSIKFPTVTLKIYQHRKEKSYRGSRDSFGNGMTRVITWEGVEYLVVTKVFCSIALPSNTGTQLRFILSTTQEHSKVSMCPIKIWTNSICLF